MLGSEVDPSKIIAQKNTLNDLQYPAFMIGHLTKTDPSFSWCFYWCFSYIDIYAYVSTDLDVTPSAGHPGRFADGQRRNQDGGVARLTRTPNSKDTDLGGFGREPGQRYEFI